MVTLDSVRVNFLQSCHDVDEEEETSLTPIKVCLRNFKVDINTVITYDELKREKLRIPHLMEYTALHLAIKKQSLKLLRYLLRQPNIDVNIRTKRVPPPVLYLLQRFKKPDITQMIFNRDALCELLKIPSLQLDVYDFHGDNLAHKLAADSLYTILLCHMVRDERMNWNSRNKNNETPIQFALKNENEGVLAALLKIPNIDKSSVNPLHVNCYQTIERLEQELREKTPPDCPVCYEMFRNGQHVFHCHKGHFVCGNCRPRMNHCAECRGIIIGRAFGMEKLISTLDNMYLEKRL